MKTAFDIGVTPSVFAFETRSAATATPATDCRRHLLTPSIETRPPATVPELTFTRPDRVDATEIGAR
jgi:hypothetical protein